MTILQAILIALVYYLANSTLLGVGFFTLHKPIASGFLVGLILGNPVLGTQIGATVQLMYMGSMSTGGTLSSDAALACIMAVSLGIVNQQPIEAAMALAVPLGILGTFMWFGRLSLSTMFVPLADKYAAEGKATKMWIANVLLPQGLLFLMSAIPVFIIVYYGPALMQGILGFLGKNVLSSLIIVGGILPALGLGMTLKSIFNGDARVYFFVGFVLIQYFGLNIISVGFIAVILSVLYMQGLPKDTKGAEASSAIEESTHAPSLLKKTDLWMSSYIWNFHAQGCYNYERMQGIGFCHSMVPIFKRLYKEGSPEMAEALQRHTGFFNTAPQFAAVIPGLVAAMEENRYQGVEDFDEESLTAIKSSLMGPLAGIGDTVSQGIVIPLLLTFFIGMAQEGNVLGPILYIVCVSAFVFLMGHYSYMLGYTKGSEAILNLLESGLINKVIDASKVMACIVMGALVARFVKLSTGLAVTIGETTFSLQTQLFDVIMPGLLPLALTLICWKMLDKGMSATKVMLLLIVVGVVGGMLKLFV